MRKLFFWLLIILFVFSTACDSGGGDDENNDTNTNNTNAPTLNSVGDRQVNPDSNLTITLQASDPNGDNLTFSAQGVGSPNIFNLGNPAVWDMANGQLTWTPTANEDGEYQVRFTVTDDSLDALSDSETITISVMGPITLGEQSYENNCSNNSCHGPGPESEKICAEPGAIQDGIDNDDGGMGRFSNMSETEVANISAYLIDVGGADCLVP